MASGVAPLAIFVCGKTVPNLVPQSSVSALLLPRIVGALALRARTFAEVAADPAAGFQAAFIVLLAAVFEAAIDAAEHGQTAIDGGPLTIAVFAATIGWLVWTLLAYGALRVLGPAVELGGLTRAIGFAHAPSLLFGLALLPGVRLLTGTLYIVTNLWFLAAVVQAIGGASSAPPRQVLRVAAIAMVAHVLLQVVGRLLHV
ncbi:MAG: hypothetical protein QOD06_290 [Candidatus Binatota bacterium]|nr:hypothetical protein [Candidatus Binatota bacterium]